MYQTYSHFRQMYDGVMDEEGDGLNPMQMPTASTRLAEHGPIPQVLAFSGGKGGVGKSLLSANLALAATDLGMQILLIDGDLGLSNLDVILNLKTRGTIDHVLSGECTLSDILIEVNPRLHLIPSSSGYLKVPELSREHKMMLMDQMEQLNTRYDAVYIDTSAGVSSNVQYWAASSSQVVIVVTPEPTSLADGYATMKILNSTTNESCFSLIVNQVHSSAEALGIYERFSTVAEEYLGVHVRFQGFVPSDRHAGLSVMQRTPLIRAFPFSDSAKAIGNIAAHIQSQSDTRCAKGTVQFFWKRMLNYCYGEAAC